MPETTKPVAATVKQIKAAYPKAKDEFIIRCMEKEMPLEEVTEEVARSMEDENVELTAKVAELEEELVAFRAMEEEEVAKAKAMEEEEEEVAKARKTGTNPIARASGGNGKDPRAEWNALNDSFIAKGKTRQQAVILANKANPGLRESLVNSVN